MDRGLSRLGRRVSDHSAGASPTQTVQEDAPADLWMTLQQGIGNQAVGRLLNEGMFAPRPGGEGARSGFSLSAIMGFASPLAAPIQRLAVPDGGSVPAAPEADETPDQPSQPVGPATEEKGEPAEEAPAPSEPDANYQPPAGGGGGGGGDGGDGGTGDAGAPADTGAGGAEAGAAGASGGAGGGGAGGTGDAGDGGGDAGGGQQGQAGAAGDSDEEHSSNVISVPETFQPGDGGSEPVLPPALDGRDMEAVAGDMTSGFHAPGRRGSIFFHSVTPKEFEDKHPHAFVPGGRKGTTAWAGGGGAGPKGNQKSGSIQRQVAPVYQGSGNGLFSNADAWVQGGTGEVDVVRDYVSSDAGDQGNGWYVTEAAASALQAHEEKHVSTAKADYDRFIQPLLDRVAKSAATGKGAAYTKSGAIEKLQNQIGWDKALSQFQKEDEQDNGQGGTVDQYDYSLGGYPEKFKDKKVRGKQYSFLLKSPMEDFPPENAPMP